MFKSTLPSNIKGSVDAAVMRADREELDIADVGVGLGLKIVRAGSEAAKQYTDAGSIYGSVQGQHGEFLIVLSTQ